MKMLLLKSRMGFKSKFYGNVDEYSILANNLVKGLTKINTFRECIDYFSEQRQDIASKSQSLNAEDFRERMSGVVFTPLTRIHRFTSVLNYLLKHKEDYNIYSEYCPVGEDDLKFPFRKITFHSKDRKENMYYQCIYLEDDPEIFNNEITPHIIIVEDNGTSNRVEEHTKRFNKVTSIKSLAKFTYYLARNVVHIRGGGSFAEYMAISFLIKMNVDVKGLNPDQELWCLAVSSTLEEFEEKFFDIFIVK